MTETFFFLRLAMVTMTIFGAVILVQVGTLVGRVLHAWHLRSASHRFSPILHSK